MILCMNKVGLLQKKNTWEHLFAENFSVSKLTDLGNSFDPTK